MMPLTWPLLSLLLRLAAGDGGEFDCGDEPYLMLEEVLHNNLGNRGPHKGEEGIVYQAVEYYKNMHRIVHVNVHAVTPYHPWDAFANGLNGRFGVFTQEAGQSVDVIFSFTTVDKKPVELRTFTVSFYDMDRDKNPGEGVETVIPKQPYTMVYVSNTTQIKKVQQPDGTQRFEGTQTGTYDDNPVKVVHEKQADEDRCVALEFKNVKEVHMQFKSTPGRSARTTQFACLNSFVCKVRPDSQAAWHKDNQGTVEVGPQDSDKAPIRARTDLLFEYTFPKHLFLGDDLTFKATRVDGSPLPAWLHFNPETLTLSGTPSMPDRGILNIKVRSEDAAGVEASTTLTMDVGGGPALTKPIPTQHVKPGAHFDYMLPKGMFIDTMDGEKLNFKASGEGGRMLPTWLHFDEYSGRFHGFPPKDAHGILEVWLTAIDSQHFSVTDKFDLIIGHGKTKLKYGADNAPPLVAKHLRAQRVSAGEAFSFQVPPGIFVDSEDRNMQITAALPDGQKLPEWLTFDPQAKEFHGTPSQGDGGILPVRVTAHDSKGKSVSDTFLLNVTGGNPPKNGGPLLPLHHLKFLKAAVARNFYYKVPPSSFGYASGDGAAVSYVAQRGDGQLLPEWLHFNRGSGTFSGMPQATDTGPLSVEVFAHDQKGSIASTSFVIDVVSSDLESVVLRDELLHTTPGSRNFWTMMMCVSLVFFAAVILLVAVGVFGFKVSIKRRFMRENKEHAPGTLRHVSCCGAEYEQYSTINREDIEILPD